MYRDGKLTTITVIKTLVKTIFRLLVLNGVVQLLIVVTPHFSYFFLTSTATNNCSMIYNFTIVPFNGAILWHVCTGL